MLMPKKTKFRKQHKGRIHGVAKGGSELAFGSFGLKAMSPERITARQIEAARRAITRHMDVCELEDASSLESNFLTVNFKVAGRVLKNRANEVKAYLAELDGAAQQALSDSVKKGENVKLDALGLEVEPDVFTLNSKPRDNVAIYTNNGEFVALDTTISEELQRAGILRDIIRQCQVFRKSAGFDVSDRIYISFKTDSALITSIIEEKKDQLCHDLLASLEAPSAVEYTGSIDLDGTLITVELQRQ